jgi:hypothetical protein
MLLMEQPDRRAPEKGGRKMSFLKDTNYHGGRAYAGERAWESIEHFHLRTSLTWAWIKLKIEKLLRLRAAPLRPSSLIHGGEKHFTLLGNRQPARRPISDIFPISNRNDRPGRK